MYRRLQTLAKYNAVGVDEKKNNISTMSIYRSEFRHPRKEFFECFSCLFGNGIEKSYSSAVVFRAHDHGKALGVVLGVLSSNFYGWCDHLAMDWARRLTLTDEVE
ncbi:hypothetical protein AVEN_258227-1 [Araneus ventricosus]|uniref:Uncharacterized protein n=1 Tax=Araneus ventricosus TaxID=182803 RepID=A0A4Y2V6H7_ARAVE|nr:hypothetical protein AVEN_258227-1 [Araneus ventricosus]